jgi:predicted nucleic-acid-binding Zn-ribbon protein
MKNTKQCPKCQSKEVFTNDNIGKFGYRNTLQVSIFQRIAVATYICTNCGYFEEYASESAKVKLDSLKKVWKKA